MNRPDLPALALLCVLVLAAGACAEPDDSGSPPAPEPVVRKSTLAGRWFSANASALRAEVTAHLDAAPPANLTDPVRALIAPHAGYRWSGPVAGRAYAAVRGRHYRRVVVLAPSHRVRFSGISTPRVTHYETPLGRVPVDVAARDALLAQEGFVDRADAHAAEHSLEIQLPFLQVAIGEFLLVPLVVGQPGRESYPGFAAAIRPLLDESTLLVVSSDFTHHGPDYDYEPFTEDVEASLRRLDTRVVDAILARDVDAFRSVLDETKATICGRRPIDLMLHLLGPDAKGTLLGYDTSGARAGSFENSVSYAAIAFTAPRRGGLTTGERRTLLGLARAALVEHFGSGKRPDLEKVELTDTLRSRRGVFVTLHQDGRLRGCIGYLVGRGTLAEDVVGNALNAALHDPRFPAVTEAEVAGLRIEISVMTPLRRIRDPLAEVVVGRHGIVLEKDGHRGVFLPQVPVEQGWDLDEYLRAICRKAGLRDPAAWREGATISTFEAEVFCEPERSRD